MTIVPSTSGVTDTTSATQATSSTSNPLNQLDNDQTFLQLLVAQLENQDPTNPTDPTAFMTEIAQLTEVQSQTSLSAEEQTVAADSMIGLSVTGTSSSGSELTGNVTGVLLSSTGSPTLEVNDGSGSPQNLPITDVTSVTQPSSDSSS